MGMAIFLILALCVAGTLSGPLHFPKSSLCAKKCLYPPADNLIYNTSYTYEYDYVGKSKVWFSDQDSATAEMDVQATIEIGWPDHCNAVIQIKNPKVLGETDIMTQLLTKHPLVVGIQNGVITDVCADPMDEPTSLNFKKGIASQIQNSLPFFSKVFNNMAFAEVDVVGACLAEYKVQADKSDSKHFIITKHKDHKKCQAKENNLVAKMMLPLWIARMPTVDSVSYSTCTQVIENNIVKSVKCEDVNEFPILVNQVNREMKALQTSSLTLQRVTKGVPEYGGDMRRTYIDFETVEESKDSKFTPLVANILKDICKNIQGTMDKSVPRLVAKMISLLYRTPDMDIGNILEDVTSGKICSNNEEMQSVFTDALTIVRSTGAIRVIMNKIKEGKFSGLRTYLYATQLHLISKPSLEMIAAVYPAIANDNMPVPVKLAVGSMVKKYCKYDPNCLQKPPVKDFYETLSQIVISFCSNSKDKYEHKIKAMVALKTAGNAGNLGLPTQKVVLACLQSKDADMPVRIAAAEAFRQAKLSPQVIDSLIKMIEDHEEQAEVRIACYLAIYSKALIWQLEDMLEIVKRQPISQVRSFILSHMRNLQLTDNPDLQKLRYSMLSLTIPQDFRKDIRKYSSNMELSKYWPGLNSGIALQSNLVYSPSSFIPRQVQLNMTANILGNVNNVLETALRMEDIESLIEMLFSPEGLLSNKVMFEAFTKAVKLVQTQGMKLLHRDKMQKQLKEIYNQVVTHISKSQGKDAKTKLDAFIRFFGEEFGFLSFSGYPRNLVSNHMIDDVMEKFMGGVAQMLMKLMDSDYSLAYMTQYTEENFIPTAQGIPLQLNAVATFVGRIYAKSMLDKSKYKASTGPEGYVQIVSFFGYTLGAKAGFRVNATAGSRNGAELKVAQKDNYLSVEFDAPNKQEILLYKQHAYFFTKRPGGPDLIVGCNKPMKLKESTSCYANVEQKLGLKYCVREGTMPKSPSGCSEMKSSKSFHLEKMKHNLPIIHLKGKHQSSKQKAYYELGMQAPAAKDPFMAMFGLQYEKHNNNKMVMMRLQLPSKNIRTLKASLTNLQSKDGSEYDLVVFSSRQDKINPATDKIIKIVAGKGLNDKDRKVFVMVSTLNQLRKYVLAEINVQAKVGLVEMPNGAVLSYPHLDRFEVDVGIQNYRSKNYIRQAQNTKKVNILSETRSPKGILLKVESSILWDGNLEKKYANYHLMAEVKTFKNSYDIESKMQVTQPEKQIMLLIQKPNKQKVALIQAKLKRDKQNWETMMEVDIPSKMKLYQLEGDMKEISSNAKMIHLMIKKEKKPLYSLSGPIKYMMEDDYYSQKSNLTMKSIPENKYIKLESDIYKSKEKRNLELIVHKTGNVLIGKLDVKQNSKPNMVSKSAMVVVPDIIDTLLKYKKSPEAADMSADVKLPMKYKGLRRIKAHSHVSFVDKKIEAQIWPDADNSPKKVIEYSSTYSLHKPTMELLSRGAVKVYGDQYKYAVKAKAGSYSDDKNAPNEIDLKLINSKNKQMEMMMRYDNAQKFEGDESSKKYGWAAALTTFDNHPYKVQGMMKQSEKMDGSLYQTIYNVTLTTTRHEVNFGTKYHAPASRKSERDLYSQASLLVKEKEKVLCSLQLERKGNEVQIDLDALVNNYNIKLYSSREKVLFFSVNENGANVVVAKCDVYKPGKWKVTVSSQNKKDPQPDPNSLAKLMTKDVKIISMGIVELDIFKKAKPLVIEAALLMKLGSYSLETVMNIPTVTKKPNLIAEFGFTQKVKVLKASLREDIHSPVLVKLEARKQQISSESYNIEANIKVPSEDIQLTAVVHKESSLYCMGLSANGTLHSQTYGLFNIVGSVCGPAYLEIGAKKPKDTAMSLAKLGLKSYSSVKLALDTVYEATDKGCGNEHCNCLSTWSLYENKWLTKDNIFMVGAKVKHPHQINFLAKCNTDRARKFRMEKWQPSVKAVKEILHRLFKDVKHTAKMLVPKELEVEPKLKDFTSVVVKKVENLPHLARSLWSELKELLRDVYQYFSKSWDVIIEWKHKIIKEVKKIIWDIFHFDFNKLQDFSLNSIIDIIKNKLKQLEKKLLDYLIKKEKSIVPEIWNIIKRFLIDHRETIIHDINFINDKFVPKALRIFSDIVVQEIDDWLMSLNNRYLGTLLVLSKNSGLSLSKQGGWMSLTLPVKTPVSSLSAGIPNIGFPKRQVALMLHKAPHPFSVQPASLKIASWSFENIITFDGLRIPVVPSKCNILMVESKNVLFEAQMLSKDHMSLEVLDNDYRTKIVVRKGKPITVIPLVKGTQHQGVKIDKVTPTKVLVTAPGVLVVMTDKYTLFQSKMKVSNGLLAAHANEVANDAQSHSNVRYDPDSPIASHHVTKETALHIFDKYRINKSCHVHL